jgi:Rps23 Pro-64 3,4-dihydroxylase Tpa1-like proline 4-hydroxylase
MSTACISSSVIDFEKWQKLLPQLSFQYQQAEPFPHAVLDHFLDEELLNQYLEEFQSLNQSNGWIDYLHFNQDKRGLNKVELLPFALRKTIEALSTPAFLSFLSQVTGIENLITDDSYEGGGIHQSARGGFLNIHSDFTVHPHHRHWRRRLNVIVYLNKDWQPEWGGDLELWDKEMKACRQKIAPIFNRCVIFNTDEDSFHGHPDPLNCPPDRFRRSIALYYYTIEKKPLKKATHFQVRPQDDAKKYRIRLDNWMLGMYTQLKGFMGANDQLVSRLLKKFGRRKKAD